MKRLWLLLVLLVLLIGCDKEEENQEVSSPVITDIETETLIENEDTIPQDEPTIILPSEPELNEWVADIPNSKFSIKFDDVIKEYYIWPQDGKLYIVEYPFTVGTFNGYIELTEMMTFIPYFVVDFGSANVVFEEIIKDILRYIKQNSVEVENGIYTLDGNSIVTFLALLLPEEIATEEFLLAISEIADDISLTVVFDDDTLTKITFDCQEIGFDIVFEYEDDLISKIDVLGVVAFDILDNIDQNNNRHYNLTYSVIYEIGDDGINVTMLSHMVVTSLNLDLCEERDESLSITLSKECLTISGSFLSSTIFGTISYGSEFGAELNIKIQDKEYFIKFESNVDVPDILESDAITSRSTNLMLYVEGFLNNIFR